MGLIACPHCTDKYRGVLPQRMLHYLDTDDALTYALSRRDREKICTICGKAEALSDMSPTIDDEQSRIAVGQDHQEALRLPPGTHHGMFGFATGGLDEHLEKFEKVYGKSEG